MKIGIDFGGVVANHLRVRVREARSMGIELASEREADEDILTARFGPVMYVKLRERIWRAALRNFSVFPLYDGARAALQRLHAEGHRFVMVSTQESLALHLPLRAYIKQKRLPIEAIYVVVENAQKLEVCRRAGLELFFDDTVEVLECLLPLGIPLVLGNFLNVEVCDNRFQVATSWRAFEHIVNQITREGRH